MHYTPLILLACSSLALATPYYHRHEGKWEEHSHKPCPSASSLDASGTDAASSLSAALPFPMEPIATAAALYTSSPAEAGTVSPPVSSAAPVAGTGSEPENGGGQEPPAHEPSSLPSYPAPTSAAAPVVVKSSAAAPVVAKSSTAAAVVPVASATGTVLVATFTSYGAGDTFGSGNCNVDSAACGFYDYPGFNAAVSQNLYGQGPGTGASKATCGTCYKLTGGMNPYADDAAVAINSIVVKINNLCPISGNVMCNQTALTGAPGTTNQFGATVNFDLCRDDGAAAALFAGVPSSVGMQKGTAVEVPCSEWTGTQASKKRGLLGM